ncbi:hypothetical protein DL89DRAFT_273380 [Linderina pennispora]|uniref:F-box domain-containing protein n=1 Tax=Linderina pennispora TaxID=61395 RepID=A0A1Y1VQ90_9FUNG|nr:uncharacterized protein DL89DRAFT_273380 [Linderina pennispora]ORX63439.1 hypothetical protein DL89DRAFT_273380 [Linderina pennispora]
MPTHTLNELPANILTRIIAFLCQDIAHEHAVLADYWEAMRIATVCRHWKFCMPPHAYRFVFVQRTIIHTHPEQRSKDVGQVVWVSNITSLLCQQNPHLPTILRVIMSDDYTGPLRLTTALGALGLTSPPWDRLDTIQFYGKGILRSGTDCHTLDMQKDANAFFDFIRHSYQTLKAIGLHAAIPPHTDDTLGAPPSPTTSEPFNYTISPHYQTLLSRFARRLSSLQCFQPTTLTFHAPATLMLASLELDESCFRVLAPEVYFECLNLRKLRLLNIENEVPVGIFKHGFAWTGPLSRLTELQLHFKSGSDSQQQTLALPAHLLRTFPKLSKLLVSQSTGVYRDAYSSFQNAPLRLLQINENYRKLAQIDTGIIRNISCLHLKTILPGGGSKVNDPAHFVTRFYLADSSVRRALLQTMVPFPTRLCWHSLVCLSLDTDIAPVALIKQLLGQLVLLKYLRISCTTMDPDDRDSYYWRESYMSEDTCDAIPPTGHSAIRLDDLQTSSDIRTTNKSLQVFGMRATSHFDEAAISRLLLSLPALQQLAVNTEHADVIRSNIERIQSDVVVCEYSEISRYFRLY